MSAFQNLVFGVIIGGFVFTSILRGDPPDAFKRASLQDDTPSLVSGTRFRENKGQIRDQNGKERSDLRFLLAQPGMNVQFRQGGISYDVHKPISHTTMKVSATGKPDSSVAEYAFHRVDVDFLGSNSDVVIEGKEIFPDYENYYVGNGTLKKYENVRSYKSIIYKNVYNSIDFVFSIPIANSVNDPNGLKFDIVVHPSGNLNDIVFCYSGDEGLELNKEHNRIRITTSLGSIEESIPFSFVESQKEGKRPVIVDYALIGKVLQFRSRTLATGKTLVIDPLVSWATYYGGGGTDRLYDIAVTSSMIYFCGRCSSSDRIATSGTHQDIYIGGEDAYLVGMTTAGVRQWGTYIGGSGIDAANSVVVDGAGSILIGGVTLSGSGLATPGAYQTSGAGDLDGFVSKFDSNGLLIWSTFYGGRNIEWLYSITRNKDNYVFVAGSTSSSNGLASTSAHQSYPGGSDDGFIACFDANGQRLWGTYMGGSGSDGCHSITSLDNDIIVAGETGSSSGIATAGAYQASLAGNQDGFVARFNSSGGRIWGTYYGGNGEDIFRDVCISGSSLIGASGSSSSTSNIATPGVYQTTLGGSRDGIVVVFTPSGARVWASYFGGSSYETGYGIVFRGENVIICGETYSQDYIATLCGTILPQLQGPYDGYLAEFSPTGFLIWGSYYGGPGTDFAYDLAISSAGVYFVGETTSNTSISTPGTHQPYYGGDMDGFVASLDYNTSIGLVFGIKAEGDAIVCPGAQVPLKVNLLCPTPPVTISWSPSTGLNDPSIAFPIATVNASMQYIVTATDATNTTRKDTVDIQVTPFIVNAISGPAAICAGDTAILDAGGGYVQYLWTLPDSSTRTTRQIIATQSGTYTVQVRDSKGCVGTSPTHTLILHPVPQLSLSFRNDTLFAPTGYAFYQWYKDEVDIPGANVHYFFPVTDTGYSVFVIDSNGCQARVALSCSASLTVMPTIFARYGEEIRIPVIVERSAGSDTQNLFELEFEYDPALLHFIGVDPELPEASFHITQTLVGPGRIKLDCSGSGLVNGRYIFTLRFVPSQTYSPTSARVKFFLHDKNPFCVAALSNDIVNVLADGQCDKIVRKKPVAGVSAYPNPFTGTIEIVVTREQPSSGRLSLVDEYGREVKLLAEGVFQAGANQYTLDGAALPVGAYRLRLITETGVEGTTIVRMK